MIDNTDSVDHASTTRPRAGLIVKDTRELAGLAVMGLALAAFVGCLTAAAMESPAWAAGLAMAAIILAVAGVVSVALQRRRTADSPAGRHRH